MKKNKNTKPTPTKIQIAATELFQDVFRGAVNAAESKVLKALEALEKNGWLVLSNFGFHTLDDRKSKRGEADFVLLGPHGILILECKGGLVKWQSSNMQILIQQSVQHNGKTIDPWYQSQKAAAFLQKAAVEYFRSYEQDIWINWGYAAIFPDAELSVQTWAGAATDRLFLDRRDLTHLAQRIEQIMQQFNNQPIHLPKQTIRPEMWRNFIEKGLSTEVNFRIYGEEYRKQALISRKQSQDFIAQFLPALMAGVPLPRLRLEGGAGTGKTMLLIERAVEASQRLEHVLVVCYNQPLKNFLTQCLKKRGATCLVLSIHDLAESLVVGAGLDLHKPTEQNELNYWYGHTIFEQAIEVLGRDFTGFFDAIFVDEAQDFYASEWWEFLKLIHKNPNQGEWLLSWDPQQSIYADVSLRPDENPTERALRIQSYMPQNLSVWRLDVNLRNSAGIHKTLQKMYPNSAKSAFTDDLQDSYIPIKLNSNSTNQYKEALQKILNQARNEYGLDPSRMVVLGPKRYEHMPLGHQAIWNFEGVEYGPAQDEQSSQQLFYFTTYRYKGLEADGVILLGFDTKFPTHQHLKWLALSRARLICWSIEV